MRFAILGPLEVVDDGGHELPVGSRMLRAVLAILLLHRGEVVSSDRLAEELWAGEPPATAAKSLQVHISRLRSALAKGAGAKDRLATVGGGYQLRVNEGELDAERFEQLLEDAGTLLSSGEAREAMDAFTAALSLWRGAPLSDFEYDSFAQAEIARLSELQVAAIEQRIAAALELGREAQVIGELERLVRAHPFRERLRGQLMLALYRSGRQADALGAYRDARSALVDELGIEPSAELRSLHESILAQDPSLLPPVDVHVAGGSQTTMLFATIEDASRLERQLGDRWAQASAAHHQVMRDAWAAAGGEEVWSESGSEFVVFRSPSAAVAAATAAQLELRELTWPDGTPRLVRIAIHMGEPQVRDGTYLGVEVQYLERLAGAAHGGQVLLSATARALAADAAVDDLGEHALRDFPTPRRVFHLVIGGARSDAFPPPRTLAQARTNLPSITTSLIGRDAELLRLTSLLTASPSRIVSLVGPGGAGKTRLAIECGTALLDSFADGVFLAALAPVNELEAVAGALCEALLIPRAPGRGPAELVIEHLRERSLLLIVDNLEHVLDAAPLLLRLADAAPRVRVLATSQAPLRLRGETVVAVDALELPDGDVEDLARLRETGSVALFVERAQATYPGFELDAENASAVAALCRRLEGLPLALELAAARVGVGGPAAVLSALDRGLDALGRGARDLPDRQRGIRAALEYTVSLLTPEVRELFAGLGAFADAWSIELVEAMFGDELDTWEGLAALSDLSLTTTRGDGRMTMAERTRRHARELLDAGGREHDVRRRHAEAILAEVEKIDATLLIDTAASLTRAHELLAEITLALGWSRAREPGQYRALLAAAGRPLHFLARLGDYVEDLAALLAADDRSDSIAGKLLCCQAGVEAMRANPIAASRWTGEAVALHRKTGPEAELLLSLGGHTWMLMMAARAIEARAAVAEAAELAVRIGADPRWLDYLDGTLACVLLGEEDYEAAEVALAKIIAHPERTDFAAEGAMGAWADCAMLRHAYADALWRSNTAAAKRYVEDPINTLGQLTCSAAALAGLGRDREAVELFAATQHAAAHEFGMREPARYNGVDVDSYMAAAAARLGPSEWARRSALGTRHTYAETIAWATRLAEPASPAVTADQA